MERNNETYNTERNLTELYGENLWKIMKDVVNFKSDDPSQCRYRLGDTAIVELKNGDTIKFVITQIKPMCIRLDAVGLIINSDDNMLCEAILFSDALKNAFCDVKCSAKGILSIFICRDGYYRFLKMRHGWGTACILLALFFNFSNCLSFFANHRVLFRCLILFFVLFPLILGFPTFGKLINCCKLTSALIKLKVAREKSEPNGSVRKQ